MEGSKDMRRRAGPGVQHRLKTKAALPPPLPTSGPTVTFVCGVLRDAMPPCWRGKKQLFFPLFI